MSRKGMAMVIGAAIAVVAGIVLLVLGYQTANFSNGIDADAAPSFYIVGGILVLAGVVAILLSKKAKD